MAHNEVVLEDTQVTELGAQRQVPDGPFVVISQDVDEFDDPYFLASRGVTVIRVSPAMEDPWTNDLDEVDLIERDAKFFKELLAVADTESNLVEFIMPSIDYQLEVGYDALREDLKDPAYRDPWGWDDDEDDYVDLDDLDDVDLQEASIA